MPFLVNDVIVEPNPNASPAGDPNFPLSGDAFAALSLVDIAALAKREYAADADFPRNAPVAAANLAGLVITKTMANALRIAVTDPAAGDGGLRVDFANLSIEVMADLVSKQNTGDLNMVYVNWMVWSAVDAGAA
ncbi:MAG: hypothetical protein AAGC95_14230 [Pseudomonadota bacterium]